MTKEDIYNHIKKLMSELFEIDSADITPESKLQEDLDIDSIDAVDLMIELKPLAGKKVSPEEFRDVRTVQDVVDAIARLLEDSKQNSENGETA